MRTLERFRGWNSTMIAFTVVFFGLALLLPVAADLAGLDTVESPATVRNDPGTPTIRAEKRGFPNISLKDGVDLGGHAPGSAPGRRLAAGDFDSDGTADLAIAGSDGGVRILRGNPAAKNSLTDEARGLAAPEPFLSVIAISDAGVTPDFFESGDFNADGHADLLAAAKGESHLILLAGYGNGSLASPQTVPVAGRITALAVGEIGQSDGQTDIAVAVNGKAGARLLVFEHPEGAFKFKPEVLPLASPAADIAVGDLNGDHYSDIAIGGGSTLTIISERGQAYPWDLAPKLGVKRPPALLERRAMPGGVAGLAIGDFSGARGRSLAVLTDDGTIYLLKPSTPKEFRQMLPDSVRGKTVAPWFVPTQTDGKFLGLLPEPVPDPQAAEANGSLMLDARLSPQEKLEAQNKRIETLAKDFAALDSTERDRLKYTSTQAGGPDSDRARKGFLRTISARPSNLGSWEIDTLVAGVGSGFSAVAKGLSAARVSVSGRDDLLMLDAASGRVKIITQPIGEDGRHGAEVVSLDSDTAPQAVLPMRLNGDALDDLVVLRDGADSPTIVRTTPTLVLIVDTDADSGGVCDGVGPCTLRRAIEIANLNPGSEVAVLIPGTGAHTIVLSSELPVVRANGTYLVADTDPNTGARLVEITGGLAGIADGIKIRASNCTVRDFVISDFHGFPDPDTGSVTGSNAITAESTLLSPNNGFNLITGNYLGTDLTGNLNKGSGTGVLVYDSDSNTITGNVMSGNGTSDEFGIGLDITAGNDNIVRGNLIGTNAAGNTRLANTHGVFLSGANNQIGGDGAGDGNTISGNGRDRLPGNPDYPGCEGLGVRIVPLFDLATGEQVTAFNSLKGNRMGTNRDGTAPIGNCYRAVETVPESTTVIGAITPNGRNIISGNGYDAIWCGSPYSLDFTEDGFCAIVGNNIGTDVTGTVAIPNDQRNVRGGLSPLTAIVTLVNNQTFSNIGAPGGTTPGGECSGFCNLISGNYNPAGSNTFSVGRLGLGTVLVINNYVGTKKNGSEPLANYGSLIANAAAYDVPTSYIGLVGSDSNGQPMSWGNLVSGNAYGAVFCGGYYLSNGNCDIIGNLIGTDATGMNALPNFELADNPFGISLGAFIGFGVTNIGDGSSPLGRNIIASNKGHGIEIRNIGGTVKVTNNFIGVNKAGAPLGNVQNGINVTIGRASIGSASPEDANVIRSNGGAGILIQPVFSILPNADIQGNRIADNGGLGIDIQRTGMSQNGDGINANDCQDEDTGSNGLQNFPVLFTPTFNGDGTVTVDGTLSSIPDSPYRIDFYSSQTADQSGYGEGETPIGSATVTTDGNGLASFTFNSTAAVPNGAAITATATDSLGNTSEFSCIAGGSCTLGLTFEEFKASPSVTCSEPIIVNVVSDEPDANTADGFCDVDTGNSGLQCTLRAAIQEANARSGYDYIEFNIPGGGIRTIAPASPLPLINKPVSVRGETQPGYSGTPLIEIDGVSTVGAVGLAFSSGSDGSRLAAVTVHRFDQAGVALMSGGNTITRSFIGLNPDGLTISPARRQNTGVMIGNSANKVGDGVSGHGNVISGNVSGVALLSANANSVVGNFIGTDKDGNQLQSEGSAVLGNSIGIAVGNGNNNEIGGLNGSAGSRNVISGNNAGIAIGSASSDSRVTGNYIGTNAAGTAAVPNASFGVTIFSGAQNSQIGGPGGGGNVISGQNLTGGPAVRPVGILIGSDAGGGNAILGNIIGLDANQQNAIPNNFGIIASKVCTIGSVSAPNVIAGNTSDGIAVGDATATVSGVTITGNLVGLNGNGQPFGNRSGIVLINDTQNTAIRDNTVSGQTDFVGILIGDGPTRNTVSGNRIGTDQAGSTAVGNRFGVVISRANENSVTSNLISGNLTFGVYIGDTIELPPPGLYAFQIVRPSAGTYTTGNKVQKNLIGTNWDGTAKIPNVVGGVGLVENARDNLIGGSSIYGYGNVISGNGSEQPNSGFGVFIGAVLPSPASDSLPNGNKVQGNRIGLKKALNEALGNTTAVQLAHARDNVIGGDSADRANIIGGSSVDGVYVIGADTTGNVIQNNYIGFYGDSPVAVPNGGDGIHVLEGAVNTTIRGNSVGGNGGHGINIENVEPVFLQRRPTDPAPISVSIAGNSVGVFIGPDGHALPVPNLKAGIQLDCVSFAVIGVTMAYQNLANIVAANREAGLRIVRNLGVRTDAIPCPGSSFNVISNTFIGTDANGTPGLGNAGNGIEIVGSSDNVIGDANAGNVIAGNEGNGLKIEGGGTNRIFANKIGIVPQGENFSALGNALNGIVISDSADNQVGDTDDAKSNLIGAMNGYGMVLESVTQLVKVRNNLIGTVIRNVRVRRVTPTQLIADTQFGNGTGGVLITLGATRNVIGGTIPNSGNRIANNGGPGVWIDTTAGLYNNVDPNSIFNNSGLGIDLGLEGPTDNDPDDADDGPNNLQNYPQISSFSIDGNGDLVVTYSVDSLPGNSDYGTAGLYVEIFKADGRGQGQLFLGSDQYTTSDHNGSLAGAKSINLGNAAALGFSPGDVVTATATDAQGNTSEFFPPFGPTAAHVMVAGTVRGTTGAGIANVRILLTGTNGVTRYAVTNHLGYYRFEGVEAGQTFVVTASHRKFRFKQQSFVLEVSDSIQDCDFVVLE